MKSIYKISTIFLLLLATSMNWGCELEEVNENPNDPKDVPMKTLLPPVQYEIGKQLGDDASIMSGIFIDYYEGITAHELPVERYIVDNAFKMNPLWSDYYTNVILPLKIIMEKAEEEDSPHYAGVAKILMAHTLGTLSSLLGDIPYREAGQGSEILNPAYEDQQFIYSEIDILLAEAITELNAGSSVYSPSTDDVLYQGDLNKWIKAAYTLRARYLMHLVKQDPSAITGPDFQDAISNGFSSASDNLEYQFGFSSAEKNPLFTYLQLTPYSQVDPFFISILDSLNDQRKDKLARLDFGRYKIGDYYAAEDAAIPMITYTEKLFLQAEAKLRTSDATAEDAAKEAVKSSLQAIVPSLSSNELDSIANTYISFNDDMDHDLEMLMTQKYIAMFTQIESWSDFRRTGYPVLTPNPNGENPQNPGGNIPRRLPYPQSEILYNSSTPDPAPNLQLRFWWDQPNP